MKLFRRWPVVLGVSVGVALVPWALFWNDLPDPVATHWGLTGTADGHTRRAAELVVVAVLTLALAACAALVAVRRSALVAIVWIVYMLTGLAVGVSLSTVLANRGATTWEDADFNLLLLALLLGPMLLLGRLGSEVAERNTAASEPSIDRPRLDLQPGEIATWTGTSGGDNPGMAVIIVVVALALHEAGMVVVLTMVFIAALGVVFGSLRVTIGANGVRVRPGLLAWPTVRLPLSRIAHAEAIDVRPLQWGGWGYRGSLRLFRRAAWVLRRGEGLRVDLTDKKVFVVTVDGAEQAAAVLNGLLQR